MTGFLLLQLFVGLVITSRTIAIIQHTNMVTGTNQRHLRWLHVNCLVPILLHRWTISLVPFFVWSFASFLVPLAIAGWVESRRIQRFRGETREFFDELALEIRGGRSLRSALGRIRGETRFGFYTREMIGYALQTGTHEKGFHHPEIGRRVGEIQRLLNGGGGKIMDRVQFFRKMHALADRFRRKSRAATQQVRAQALVVSLMYGALLIFQLVTNSVKGSSPWVYLSFVLLICGLLSLRWIMRSFRWKV